jgi:catechol 2,3-dioxygenase-like lactoylglutathione lyase family enzyme
MSESVTTPIKNQIGAIFIPVKDIQESRDWYCDLLALPNNGGIYNGHLYILPMVAAVNLVLDSKIYSEATLFRTPVFHFNTHDNTHDIEAAYWYIQSKGIELLLMICRC